MPFYKNAEQIYNVMQALFDKLRDIEPDPVETLVSSRMTFRINLIDPEAQITVNGRKRPVTVDYGSKDGRADLEIEMEAETLHLIMLDKYSVKRGFSNGELKVRGPIWKALSFAEIFQKGRSFYPEILKDQDLN